MPTIPSITFLIGGKYSLPADVVAGPPPETPAAEPSAAEPQRLSEGPRRGRADALHWYMPGGPGVYNFYRFSSEYWGDVYGENRYGAVGLDGERYFGWEHAGDPTYDHVRAAADRLLDRCRRLREEYGVRHIRFVGHSAGCFVANVATHHADFAVDQLLLCSPSVPRRNSMPRGWSWRQIAEAFPNVDRLAAGKFFYFYVRPDTVLAYLRRDTHYRTPLVEQEFPDVFAAARTPGPLRTLDLLFGHWRTVHPCRWQPPARHGGVGYLDWLAAQ